MRKSSVTILILIYLTLGFSWIVFAQTTTPTPSNLVFATLTADNQNHALAGSGVGDLPSFDVAFSLGQLPTNVKIQSASLSYTQNGTSSGLVKIIDKYSTSILDSKGLGTVGVITSDRINDSLQNWINFPNRNLGLLFQGSDLAASDSIQFIDIVLTVSYIIPDTTPPVFNDIDVIQTTNSTAIIKVDVSEPSVFTIKYGKTSIYDKTADFKDNLVNSGELKLVNLQGGVGYHYLLTASDLSGNSTSSGDSTFTTILQSGNVLGDTTEKIDPNLSAPSGLVIELTRLNNKYTANLAWKAATGDIDGYVIYRGFESLDDLKEYKRVGIIVNFIDSEVLEEHSYYYYVRAYKGISLSTKSDNVAILVPKVPLDQSVLGSLFSSSDTRVQLILLLFAAAVIVLCVYYLFYKGTKSVLTKFGPKPKKVNVLKDPDFYR
jgi:hypothetical protein